MASLRNAMKTNKVHRERDQPFDRKHLGALEKRKDYKERAKHTNEKKETLKYLHKRALEKNPDEFHYHMVNSGLKGGVHCEKIEDEEYVIHNVSTDLTYVTHRRSVEKKKIEKLQAQLHLLENKDTEETQNSHILFVDDDDEVEKADPAQMLGTHPALMSRSFNRLRISQLAEFSQNNLKDELFNEISEEKNRAYTRLARLIKRENKLRIMQEKLEVRKKLMENQKKNGKLPTLVQAGTSTTAPVYKWPNVRKK